MAGNGKGTAEMELSYKDDPRMPCKYGAKCYQKNKNHHEKYKHPPKKTPEGRGVIRKVVDKDESCVASSAPSPEKSPEKKKIKLDTSDEEAEQITSSPSHSNASEPVVDDPENALPPSPEDVKESIKQKFLCEMPEDFYQFWDFCKNLSSDSPARALKEIGLMLVGPYDVLSGELKKVKHRDSSSYLRHWRYYFDPPEFQTIIKGDDKKQYHMGYYRDDPQEMPVFVACNSAAVSCTISPLAGNVFGAVNAYLNGILKSGDPFTKIKVPKYQNALKKWAEKEGISLEAKTAEMKARSKKVVSTTFHNAGIVVPCDKKSQVGYRELLEPDAQIKKILTSIMDSETEDKRKAAFSKLQPIVTAANIANDECDFGASLELGLDLFAFGGEPLHPIILQLLQAAYKLLNRPEFAVIIKAHLQDRKKGVDLSIVK
ncbi:histone PARylation factor 1 [Ischnura elegans]|uniref:histone PARylation factor 1 n=1 Tax=Ischnura elegans TaxID=197161 RepID=UPI001ED88E6C|nr:histone PARylation factor 1 [Ischnura elegans]